MEIYAAFTLWLLLILFAGIGVYRLLAGLILPRYLDWVLLPGTLVSEMAYILGCLITGGEIRRAKLMPAPGGGGEAAGPTTEAVSGGGWKPALRAIVASLLAIVACVAAILTLRKVLGAPVLDIFTGLLGRLEVPRELPHSADAFWAQVEFQARLLRRMCETWAGLQWSNWRVPLFVYLTGCLSIRMGSANKPLRPTLAATALLAALIGLVGLVSKDFSNLMSDLWPLLTYLWASLLFLLAATLLIRGLVGLGKILTGRDR